MSTVHPLFDLWRHGSVPRYQKYREEEAKRLEAKAERKRIREEKIARGEKVGPDEEDEDKLSLWDIIKTLLVIFGMIALTGQLVTGSLVWGTRNRLTDVRSWWPVSKSTDPTRVFVY